MNYENIFSIVTENIDNGVFIVNKFGNVIFYNEPVNNLAGVTVENAIGQHILDIFPKLTEETSTILRVLKTGEPIKDYIQKYYNYQLKQVTILTSTLPLFNNNELVGAIEIFKDIDIYKKYNNTINTINGSSKKKASPEKAYYNLKDIIGTNSQIIKIKEKIIKIANSPSSVLIYGETGTGKELIVQSLHNESERKNKPFIAQNCAAIPSTLLESILFGTTLGSFTGSKDSPGLFEISDGGTLFLDEINSMNINLQTKLLRVLQDGIVRRVGGKTSKKVDIRVIAALNTDPIESIIKGELREDLYYRLNVLSIKIPSLRDRKDDISVLTEHFINIYNHKLNKKINSITTRVKDFFYEYNWPGNVRELKHMIEHAVNLTDTNFIDIIDLPEYINNYHKTESKSNKNLKQNINKPLKELLYEYERKIIIEVLKDNKYNISAAANILGIPRQTLYYKFKKLNIEIEKNLMI